MSIGKKLLLSFGAMAALFAILALISLSGFRSLSLRFGQLAEVDVKNLELIEQFDTAVQTMRLENRGVLLYSETHQPAKLDTAKQAFQKALTNGRSTLNQLTPLLVTEQGRTLAAEAKKDIDLYDDACRETTRLLDAGQFEEATAYSAKYSIPVGVRTSQIGPEISRLIVTTVEQNRREVASQESSTRWTTVFLVLFASLAAVLVFGVIRRVNSQLRELAGDLAAGSEQTASAAFQVSSSSQTLAQGASEQAASLEETSSSTVEISSMTQRNAENSKESAKFMVSMASQIGEGNRKLNDMVASMKEINNSSEKISKIIKTIDDIAFQTNILALNAAVEAARAGEAGMGFAVVADEVRNLAQRCAQAAKETASLIEESVSKSQDGAHKLDGVAKAIGAITADADNVKTLVDEVSLSSQEQARGLEQISKAISQMEQLTQKTAATAEESASAGEQLSAQSETLRSCARRLAMLVGGESAVNVEGPEIAYGTSRNIAPKKIESNKKPIASPRMSEDWVSQA
jgi:methyl-accepting chemotaxis protein/methyl-accepting chemotaxis protein-1 (serine sensor receptor)